MPRSNLIVVAHPDDEVLGAGATGARLSAEGEEVTACILVGNAEARTRRPSDEALFQDMTRASALLALREPIVGAFPNIRLNTVPHLELVQFIEAAIGDTAATRIFTHHPNDLNNDHVQVSLACQAAARLFQRRTDIPALEAMYFMEVPSATDWAFPANGHGFSPDTFCEIEGFLERKIEALSCYRHVIRDYPHPRSEDVLRALATYRGGQAGQNLAEAFQTVYAVIG